MELLLTFIVHIIIIIIIYNPIMDVNVIFDNPTVARCKVYLLSAYLYARWRHLYVYVIFKISITK